MADLTQEQRVQRGRRAALLLEDDLLKDVDSDAVQEWREGKTVEEREAAWATIHALEKVQQKLHSIMADGQHAQAEIDRATPLRG